MGLTYTTKTTKESNKRKSSINNCNLHRLALCCHQSGTQGDCRLPVCHYRPKKTGDICCQETPWVSILPFLALQMQQDNCSCNGHAELWEAVVIRNTWHNHKPQNMLVECVCIFLIYKIWKCRYSEYFLGVPTITIFTMCSTN